MKQNMNKTPANQDEITLYCLLGEALCKTQIVEQASSNPNFIWSVFDREDRKLRSSS